MKINIIALFILLFHFNVYAQLDDIPFKKGENLEYKIHYGPIAAGMASFEVKTFQDQFKFIATGKSKGVFNLFFKVKDHYESIVDKNSLNPNRFYRKCPLRQEPPHIDLTPLLLVRTLFFSHGTSAGKN